MSLFELAISHMHVPWEPRGEIDVKLNHKKISHDQFYGQAAGFGENHVNALYGVANIRSNVYVLVWKRYKVPLARACKGECVPVRACACTVYKR